MKRMTGLLLFKGASLEHHQQPLASSKVFTQRMLRCAFLASVLLLVTISVGALVYHDVEGQPWVDAYLNAVMVMAGLGLSASLVTTVAKIFTTFYALISSIVFFVVLGVLFAPLIHRFLHRFHLDSAKD